MINREQAAQIAADALHFVADGTTYDLDRVMTMDEIAGRPPVAYITSNESIKDCWVVYMKRKQPILRLESSTIMLVSKASGRMVYFGGANDEG